MTEILLTTFGVAGGSGVVGYLLAKRHDAFKYQIYLEQAKAKAKAIEHEAELYLQNAKNEMKNLELELRKKNETEAHRLKLEHENKLQGLSKKEEQVERRLEQEMAHMAQEKSGVKKLQHQFEGEKNALAQLQKQLHDKLTEAIKILESGAGLTREEAKNLLLKRIEEDSRADIAHVVRKIETEAKADARRRANFIIAQATTRYAGEFASERLINVVTLSSDEIKGRIIGKEGRNIKVLENLLGVDIIIDDTPGAIILSSFNLYRRAIATRTLEVLIEDGRIQPARIEEIYEKVREEFDEKLLNEGEQIVMDLGIGQVHPELVKLIGRLKFRASYGQNALAHSLEVAHLSGIIAAELGGNEALAKRAGLLHDIGKSLTHEFSGSHVDLGADVCRRYKEDAVVINAIFAHHGHEEALSIESAAVCTADALSAARPGARREVLESFLKRVQQIEEIATTYMGVKQAYAISAGKELRVIVNASLVTDDESVLLSREIAKEIEDKVQYPGEIRVTVLRESRSIGVAR